MPKVLLDFLGYTFYFYSNEIVLEHNKGNIPKSDLKKIQKYICANRAQIVNRWYEFFGF